MKPTLLRAIVFFSLGLALAAPSSAEGQSSPSQSGWQKYWKQMNAYARSPEAKRLVDGSVSQGHAWLLAGESWLGSIKLQEKVALLAEFWRNRDSIDLLCLLEPENFRLLTSIDVKLLQTDFARWQSSVEKWVQKP